MPAYSVILSSIFRPDSIPDRFPVCARNFQNCGSEFSFNRSIFLSADPKALAPPAFQVSAVWLSSFRVARVFFRRLDPEGRVIRALR